MKLKKLVKRLLARFTSPLPNGMNSFDEYIQSIISLYDLPDNPSYHRMIAMMVQHLPPHLYRAPKHYFYKCILRAQANEAAFHKLQALKEAEATAKTQAATPDVEPLDGSEDPPGTAEDLGQKA